MRKDPKTATTQILLVPSRKPSWLTRKHVFIDKWFLKRHAVAESAKNEQAYPR